MDTPNVSPRERQLVDVARRARRYLDHESHGMHEDILLGRELVRILALYDDVAPVHDADRRAREERHSAVAEPLRSIVNSFHP